MAAKKKYPAPKPAPNRPWSELTPAERNREYVRALHAFNTEGGPNPETRGAFYKTKESA